VTLGDDVMAAFAACPVVIDFSVPAASLACLRVAARTRSPMRPSAPTTATE